MKWSLNLFLLCLSVSAPLAAQNSVLMRDVINDPNVSIRCRELIDERQDKLLVQTRLSSLMQRNKTLLKQTPVQKNSIRKKLEYQEREIRNELYLSTLKVRSLEETIVRTGCPGINL